MIREKREQLITRLRVRIVRAIGTGALRSGDRVPSTRELAKEMDVDPRLVSIAYAQLQTEGLVEMRPRSGIYITAAHAALVRSGEPPVSLLASTLTSLTVAGYGVVPFVRALEAAATVRALKTMVVASTADQGLGLARELRDDFGLDTSSVLADRLKGDSVPDAVRRAQLLLTTRAHEPLVTALAARLSKRCLVVRVRSDLFEREWARWGGEDVWIIVLDPRFRSMVQHFLRESGADVSRVRVLLATDDLSQIADDAPTYVTQAARIHMGSTKVPGMLIPPTRLLRDDCTRELWEAVIELNQAAAARSPRATGE